ncbi:methyltransferase domain-containing protein [Actinomadura geliboluensis]|uniref:methyltransferase domain-containing protein n=1 Tax=Actinomadura geliboluensis TaxID=882440 RepID=UPI0037149C09
MAAAGLGARLHRARPARPGLLAGHHAAAPTTAPSTRSWTPTSPPGAPRRFGTSGAGCPPRGGRCSGTGRGGCGTGGSAAYLAHQGADVTATDGAVAQIHRARRYRRHPRLAFQQCRGRGLPRPASGPILDLITSVFGALDWSPPDRPLPLIARQLRPFRDSRLLRRLTPTGPATSPRDSVARPVGRSPSSATRPPRGRGPRV